MYPSITGITYSWQCNTNLKINHLLSMFSVRSLFITGCLIDIGTIKTEWFLFLFTVRLWLRFWLLLLQSLWDIICNMYKINNFSCDWLYNSYVEYYVFILIFVYVISCLIFPINYCPKMKPWSRYLCPLWIGNWSVLCLILRLQQNLIMLSLCILLTLLYFR